MRRKFRAGQKVADMHFLAYANVTICPTRRFRTYRQICICKCVYMRVFAYPDRNLNRKINRNLHMQMFLCVLARNHADICIFGYLHMQALPRPPKTHCHMQMLLYLDIFVFRNANRNLDRNLDRNLIETQIEICRYMHERLPTSAELHDCAALRHSSGFAIESISA